MRGLAPPYDLFKPCGIRPPVEVAMREEEMDGLDLLVHLIDPDLVLEIGTHKGGSAWILSEHVPVVSVDHNPIFDRETLKGRDITFVKADSPAELNRLDSYVAGKRWLFFHDSLHNNFQLSFELGWAERAGAVAAVWHDVALKEPCAVELGSMLEALASFQKKGYRARRMQHFGVEETGYDMSKNGLTGLGFTWF